MTKKHFEGSFSVHFIEREKRGSSYDWADILLDGVMVGKTRCLIGDGEITVYSINIFPEYQGRRMGEQAVELFKKEYGKVIADRVRPTAVGFWEKMGFRREGSETFVYSPDGDGPGTNR